MESILQFMYLGAGKFYYERMAEFIKVSKDLEVKDISQGVELPNAAKYVTEEEEEETDEDLESTKTLKNQIRQRQPRNQISSDAKSTECPECGAKYFDKSTMLRHYREKHKGIKYPCDHCDYQATQQSNLQVHIQSKHEGIKYPCNQCDNQFTIQGNLQRHIRSCHA